MAQTKARTRALAALTASMLLFGTIGLLRRGIDAPSSLLALVRAVVGTGFLSLYCARKHLRLMDGLNRRQWLLLVLSGAVMGFNWIALFESYRYTSLAAATMCYYMQPTILIVFSPVLFRERLTPLKLLCADAGVLGMALVSGVIGTQAPAPSELRGIALGLTAAVLYAAVIILNKKAGSVNPYQRTVLQLGAAAVALAPYVLLTEDLKTVHLNAAGLGALAVLGLVHTGLAYTLYFGSMEPLSAQTIALFSYIDPVTALLLSALLLREPLSLTGWLGAALILAAAVLGERTAQRESG